MSRSRSTISLFAVALILITMAAALAGEPVLPPAAEVAPAPVAAPATPTPATEPPTPVSGPEPSAAPTPAMEPPTRVSEPPAAVIAAVEIQGSDRVSKEDILAAVTSKAGAVYSEADVKRDRDAIFALGWFETVSVDRETTETGIRLVFRVVENPVITDIQFQGATVLTRDQLLAVMKIKPGTIFNSARLTDDSRAIDQLYRTHGYILALVLPARMSSAGVLTLEIAEGVIETIKVTGNTLTKDKVIRRYIRTRPGVVYNLQGVMADVGRLSRTRWFETVNQSAEVGSEPGKVVLVITIVEKKRTGQATVGGGYSSVQGIVGFVEMSKDNLRGTGQMVSVRGEFGGRSSYEFYYRHPWVATPETRLNLGLYNRLVVREAFVNVAGAGAQRVLYDERRTGGSVTLGRPLSDRTTAFLSFRDDRVRITGTSADTQALLTGPAFQPSDVRSITPAVSSDWRDNQDYPRRGGFYQATAELAGLLGGSASFDKYSLDVRRYHPLGKKAVFAARLLVGSLTGDAPYLEQFLIGGGESLRGYPTDRFVGTNMAVLNTELRVPFGKNLVAVAFVDMGDAWGGNIAGEPTISGDTSFTAHLGYGLGIRVATPIGPLRLDLGLSEEGMETHFGLAQMF